MSWKDDLEEYLFSPQNGFYTPIELTTRSYIQPKPPATDLGPTPEEPVTVEDRVESYIFGTFFYLTGDEEKASKSVDNVMEFVDIALDLEREEIAKMLDEECYVSVAALVRDRKSP